LRRRDLEKKWEPGTKLLILNFPTNPTGGVIDSKHLAEIAAFAVEKDLIVLSDEIYAELTYEGEHVSIASFPGMRDRTVFLHGVSKAFAMTGFRIGYACAPHAIIEAMMKVHQYAIMSVPIFLQEAAIAQFRGLGGLDARILPEATRLPGPALPCHGITVPFAAGNLLYFSRCHIDGT
jgi:aminotransferase